MEQYIYADILFLVNFSMDYLCLYISAAILRRAFSLKRLLLASAIGGIYSVISLILPFDTSVVFIFDILMCVILCTVSFHSRGGLKSTATFTLLYFAVSMAMGGIMTALFNLFNKLNLPLDGIDGDGLSVWGFAILAVSAGVLSLIGGNTVFKKKEICDCTVSISFDNKEMQFRAISDSGNLVCDPISGKPVIIIDRKRASGFVDTDIINDFLHSTMSRVKAYRSMRIAPISTVSGKDTLVLLRADKISISYIAKGKERTITPDVLFAIGDIGSNRAEYHAIVPSSVFRG